MNQSVKADNLLKHSLATEAILRALAVRLGKDPETWGLAGLLHDLDFEETRDTPETHGLRTAEILQSRGVLEEVLQSIRAHNAERLGLERKTELDFAVTCGEAVTGLIVATALVYPDKKVASVKPQSVTKRMKEKYFARNVNRDLIRLCEKLGLPLDEFVSLSVTAMQGISADLGL